MANNTTVFFNHLSEVQRSRVYLIQFTVVLALAFILQCYPKLWSGLQQSITYENVYSVLQLSRNYSIHTRVSVPWWEVGPPPASKCVPPQGSKSLRGRGWGGIQFRRRFRNSGTLCVHKPSTAPTIDSITVHCIQPLERSIFSTYNQNSTSEHDPVKKLSFDAASSAL